MKSTSGFSAKTHALRDAIESADAIVVGAGSGLSAATGLTYDGERFEKNFTDFIAKYHFRDMYSATFYPYTTREEYWAYMSRHIYFNRYCDVPGDVYQHLLRILTGKDYFVITTNVDHCFQKSGYDKKRLFYTQGDYGLWQCSSACEQKTYDNEDVVRRMIDEQKDLRIPTELAPHCPACGKPMAMNLRCDDTFVQDAGWHQAAARYSNFLRTRDGQRILFLELGVGGNTPVIIKYPFWKMTLGNSNATYACINLFDAAAPREIAERSICIEGDISEVVAALLMSK